jgi:hypothetical protein
MPLDGKSTHLLAVTSNDRVNSGRDGLRDVLSVVLLAERAPDLFYVRAHRRFDEPVYELRIRWLCLAQSYGVQAETTRLASTPIASFTTSTRSPGFSAGSVGPSQPNQMTSFGCRVR